jgi:hypothetical protein
MRKQTSSKSTWTACILITAALTLIFTFRAKPACGDDTEELVNYSFGIWLGSGFYRVADKRVAVLRIPFRYTLREEKSSELPLKERLGLKLLLPALVGYQDETDIDFSFGAGAFVPGLEVQVPINKYWTLKPFAQFGVGKDTAGGDFQYIYGGGAKSLVSVPWKKFVLGIGNSIALAQDRDATTDDHNGFSLLNMGLDVRHPTAVTLFNRKLDVSVFGIYYRFFNRVDFYEELGSTKRINWIGEVGMTFGIDDPVSIWGIKFDRVGIDYRWGNRFRGIGFNMGFPF